MTVPIGFSPLFGHLSVNTRHDKVSLYLTAGNNIGVVSFDHKEQPTNEALVRLERDMITIGKDEARLQQVVQDQLPAIVEQLEMSSDDSARVLDVISSPVRFEVAGTSDKPCAYLYDHEGKG